MINFWVKTPLYLRIIGAVVLGLIFGLALGKDAALLSIPAKLILRLLTAIAPPLILLAIIQALVHAQLREGQATRLAKALIINTLVAICIGLFVANLIKPGALSQFTTNSQKEITSIYQGPITQFLDNIPKSILGPFTDDGKVIGVIIVALAFGIAFRRFKNYPISTIQDLLHIGLSSLTIILNWVVNLVPLAVFGIVASTIGLKGFSDFIALGWFVLSVIFALLLQACYYLTLIRFKSWVSPLTILSGARDALFMAFSTSSSTATMPITYACLRNNIKLREESASLGALVGSNFNNDGTALYEAMSALFVAQLLNLNLTLFQQLAVAITSIAASVGAAGIPEAGLVTMTMVFGAVGLPTEYIAILLTVDWLLDRCRTTINVMGDITVSCLLDGRSTEQSSTKNNSVD